MLQDEFDKLLKEIATVGEGEAPDINKMLNQTLSFFHSLGDQLNGASSEEQKEILASMQDMKGSLDKEIKGMCERSGLDEEQLMGMLSDNKQFSPEQQGMLSSAEQSAAAAAKHVAPKSKGDDSKNQKDKDKWMKS